MRSMSFRLHLALFFVATMVGVQLVTAGLVYEVTRRALVSEGERELTVNSSAFVAQMDDISARIAGSVNVLSLDYALRKAIAERDHVTVLSVLRNHGRRVGASRMLLVDLDGSVEVDTDDADHVPGSFPFPDLINSAYDRRTAAVVALDGKASWMVVVPIYAPQPVGLVVVNVPLDDTLLAHIQQLSALPRNIELAAQLTPGQWSVLARGEHGSRLVDSLAMTQRDLPRKPLLTRVDGKEYIVLAHRLRQPEQGTPVVAVLGYSLDDALRPFRAVAIAWAIMLGLGLGAGLLGAWLIARSVSRPIEALAVAVRRIEAGDYRVPVRMQRDDEIGELASAFGTMTEAVRQRELRISHQAMHDGATDLPNRVAAETTIKHDLAENGDGAMLVVGLTRLPDIIKTLGHALGDRLMRDAGTRIRQVADGVYLARISDTQFMLWLPRVGRAAAVATALRVLETLNVAYQENDFSIDRLPSVGITMAPADGRHAAAARGGGAVRRQWFSQCVEFLRRSHRPASSRAIVTDGRPARSPRSRRAGAALPAQTRSCAQLCRWRRGTAALESSAARLGGARRLHQHGRGYRQHPAGQPLGAGQRARTGAAVDRRGHVAAYRGKPVDARSGRRRSAEADRALAGDPSRTRQ